MVAVEVGESQMRYLAILLQMHQVVHRLVIVRVVVVPPELHMPTIKKSSYIAKIDLCSHR